MRTAAWRTRQSLRGILARVVILLTVIPFLPVAWLMRVGYGREVENVEHEIQESNRHIAELAAAFLETLIGQLESEARMTGAVMPRQLPPQREAIHWERVDDAGVVAESHLSPDRVGLDSGYGAVLGDTAAGGILLSRVGPWIPGHPPTLLLVHRPPAAPGCLVAIFDPAALHRLMQALSGQQVARHVYAVDGAGNLIFYSDLAVSARGADLRSNPPIRRFLAGGDGDIRYSSVVSGRERLGFVRRLQPADWGVIVSADPATRLLALRARYRAFWWSIGFALVAAVAVMLWTSRRLGAPLLDMVRSLRDPRRPPHAPLAVPASVRVLAEYDELVGAFDELSAEVAAIERELVEAEKSALMGRLASGLAHEMGTPLNVISGNAQFLLRKPGHDDSARAVLQQIVDQSQRIADMIRRLLDVSRPSELRLVPLNLGELVEQTLTMLPGIARDIEVVTDLAADAPRVLADPKLLEHALLNLLVNACQAMPNGGQLRVEVASWRPPEAPSSGPWPWVELRVVDTGCGIPPADLGRVFEPFFTTKAHGKGTGLGLAIVHRIVRQHGGAVTVASSVGRGSTFTIRLKAVLHGHHRSHALEAADEP